MAAPDPDTQSLIRRLVKATTAGKLRWEAESESAFWIKTDRAEVRIESEDKDGEHPYHVEIRNAAGMMLGGGTTIPGEGYASWENEIAELYVAARNTALGITQTYDQFAKELGLPEDDDIPF